MNIALVKKKYVGILGFTLAFLCLSQLGFAAEKSVRLGYYSGFNIFGQSQKNNAKALGHDSLMELAQHAHVKVQLIDLHQNFVQALDQELVDMVGLVVPLPHTEDKITYSKNIYGYAQFGLATKHTSQIYYDDPASIKDKKVATFHGNNANVLFEEYLEKNNISVDFVYGNLNSYTELEADYYLIFSSIKNIHDFEIALKLGKRPLHLATKKGQEIHMQPFEEAFTILSDRKTSIVSRIEEKFKQIDDKFDNRSLTKDEAKQVRGKTFRVGFLQNNPPYQYLDDNGKAQGISIDILNLLAKKYQFHVDYVPYSTVRGSQAVDFSTLDFLLSLRGKKAHVEKFFQSTDPYYLVQMIMLIKKSGDESIKKILEKEAKIGMVQKISFDHSELSRIAPKAAITYHNTFEDLLTAFEEGEVNSAIFTSTDAQYASAIMKKQYHLYPLGIELPIQFHIAHALAEPYLDIFNTMLSNISYQELYQINFQHTSSYSPQYDIIDFLLENWAYILVTLLSIIFIFVMYLMRAQVKKKNEILKLLYTDDVTSLISPRYFGIQVQKALKTARPNEYELITLDIDYFRMINKHYGMEKGTQVICYMADSLQQAYAGNDVVLTRNHSEQFAIFKKIDEGYSIEHVVENYIVRAIQDVVGKNYSLTMSTGIYPIQDPHEETSDMIDFADIARRRGKALHKITYVTFNERMRQDFLDTLRIVHTMENALKDGEFKIVFQPKVSFDTLKIIGAEALVRWIPAEGGPIYPDKFISTMETDGFITELDLYVFEKVCAFIQENTDIHHIPKIAINLSAVTMCEASIVEKLLTITQKYGVCPKSLELELTESALNAFEATIIAALAQLKEHGFSIAMDDFGTGESSLNRLGVIKVDVLKLDKSFLNFNQESDHGHIVVEKIIELAKELNMQIVSEGVETLEQVLWLRNLKCHIAQGYYFSRPIPVDEFKKLLQDDITYTLDKKDTK